MNFTHLAAFHAIAITGTVTAASERLHVSQPALTREVRELEDRLGIALFNRIPRGMELTEAGHMLMQFASQIFSLADAAEQAVTEFSGVKRGRLQLAASRTVGTYLLPHLVEAFYRQFQGIEVELVITNTDAVATELIEHRCQLGFIEGSFDKSIFDATVIGHDELVLVSAPSHRLATRRTLSFDMLAKERVILRESGSGMREAVELAYRSRGVEVESMIAMGSTEAIKQLVSIGGGLAWMSRYAIRAELDNHTLAALPVKGFKIDRDFQMIQLKGRTLSPSSRAFANLALRST